MAVKELTVAEKLKALYKLQTIDSKIDEIQVLKGELPMEVQDLEDDLAGLQTRINNLNRSVKEYQSEINRHEANKQQSDELILRYNSQLDNVKNNREYESLMKEIELQKLEKQLSDKKIRGSQKMIDEKQALLDSAQENYDQRHKELEDKKVELEKIIKDTDKEEKTLNKQSEKARKNIEPRLLRAYDKIRKAYRNGLSVVTVERNSCGGCFNFVPAQLRLEIGQRKKVIVCEHCGRILVDPLIGADETDA